MPAVLSQGNCQYTPISTSGTTTVNRGGPVGGGPPAQPGVYYGAYVVSVGTSFVAVAYDIYQSGTSTVTNVIGGTQTATAAGQTLLPGAPGVGVRYRGDLVIVTSGTAGAINALWD